VLIPHDSIWLTLLSVDCVSKTLLEILRGFFGGVHLELTHAPAAFTCQIDTGSSDLWVIPPQNQSVPTVNSTDVIASVLYADGSGITGHVAFAELMISGYTVKSQGACPDLYIASRRSVHVPPLISVH
jgi:hypothetical protein